MSYTVHRYQPGDEEEIVDCLVEVFDGWPHFDLRCSPVDHWRWKFIDNPPKLTVATLAKKEREIIGCFHGLPQRLKIGGQTYLSCQGVDAATHPDYGGMGVYSSLRRYKFELMRETAINFYYVVSAHQLLIDKNKREGRPALPFTLEQMLRIHDIDLHLRMDSSEKSLIKRYGYRALRAISRLKGPESDPAKTRDDLKIEEIKEFDHRIDGFWSNVAAHHKLIIQRDRDYLNWRYCDPRGGEYDVRIAEADGRIHGYIVLRVNRYVQNYPTGCIVDLLTLPGQTDVAGELAKYAVEYFDDRDVNMVQVNVLKNSSHEPIFHGLGFVKHPYKPFMNYAAEYGNGNLDELSKRDVGVMHFSFGDYDWI
jgi:hypothetical protein